MSACFFLLSGHCEAVEAKHCATGWHVEPPSPFHAALPGPPDYFFVTFLYYVPLPWALCFFSTPPRALFQSPDRLSRRSDPDPPEI